MPRRAVLGVFVLIYAMLEVGSYVQKSATYDEPLHLAGGYAALVKGDHRLDPTHPPLVRMWAALPLLAMPGVDIDTSRMDGLTQEEWMPRQNLYAHDFLYNGRDADWLLGWARAMIVALGALLGAMVFGWAEAWLGRTAGVVALVCYLLSPNLAAHASLVTTDLGVTCFYFGTIFFLWRTCRDYTRWNVGGLALCFSLAVVSKFSAVLLIPTVGLLLAWSTCRPGPMTWRRAGAVVVTVAAATWFMIWAVYGFRFAPAASGVLLHAAGNAVVSQRLPVIAPLLAWIDTHRLLPNAFTEGFLMCFVWSEKLPDYLAGNIAADGWWYYYPVAFLVKTPAVLLALIASGLAILIRRRREPESGAVPFILVPPVIYFTAAMTTGINIGVRHLLPVYPFLLLIAAAPVVEVVRAAWKLRTKALVLGTALGCWSAAYFAVYPNTLTFFNWIVGGPGHGLDYLADSNLDWGQHLKLLKRWMDRRGVKRINLAYFGTADPRYYGIDAKIMPGARDYLQARIAKPELPGYVAISATVSSGVYLAPAWRLFYEGFDDLAPAAEIGHTIKIYWVDKWPEPARPLEPDQLEEQGRLADGLYALGSYRHAVYHYQEFVRDHPNDGRSLFHLGRALLDLGRKAEAEDYFRRAVEFVPANANLRDQFATMLIQQGRFLEAVGQARILVRLRPDSARAHDLLGVALAGDSRLGEAVSEFETALKIDPSDNEIRHHLALVVRERHARSGLPGPVR